MALVADIIVNPAILAALVTVGGAGSLTYIAWMTKTILRHAEIMSKLEVEFTNTNAMAVATAAELAALTQRTADALSAKVDAQAAEIATVARQTAATLAAKVEAQAARVASKIDDHDAWERNRTVVP